MGGWGGCTVFLKGACMLLCHPSEIIILGAESPGILMKKHRINGCCVVLLGFGLSRLSAIQVCVCSCPLHPSVGF